MERAPHPVEEDHHPAPIARDPELPAVSDGALMAFAAAALVATALGLILLIG
jgi:hypothetical protein